ncbi:MAG TPA: hypothetical protein VMT16_05645 [Thermoanaerobaculia bacterium]|nr:hypothetical protein [Thermoanaerobaculia bacterium]
MRRRTLVTVALALLAAAGWLLWLLVPRQEGVAGLAGEAAEELVEGTALERMADAAAAAVEEDACGRDWLPPADRQITGNAVGDSPVKEPHAGFSLQFRDEVSPYSLMSAFVLPGEALEMQAVFTHAPTRLEASTDAGELVALGRDRWRWVAPEEPGVHCLEVRDRASGAQICLNAFVMRPYHGEEVLDGYRIGRYERLPLEGRAAYRMPRGMVEVTKENLGTWVSPHFRLAQFVCKQESGYPKYVVLHTRLLLKLEMVLEELAQSGIDADTLYVMSGYRTPFYNAAIGNRTRYSRHAYGDAADVFVDRDGDGVMDDINGDGRSDTHDALWIYGMVEDLSEQTWYQPFVGGLGIYPRNPAFGPMVHLDTRGHRARWRG